jgi:hypothetical protein
MKNILVSYSSRANGAGSASHHAVFIIKGEVVSSGVVFFTSFIVLNSNKEQISEWAQGAPC